MTNFFEIYQTQLETHKLTLAAKNLQNLLKIQEEQVSLEQISQSLKQTLLDTNGNNPVDFCEMMAVQARILDAAFTYMVDKTDLNHYSAEDKLAFAMKAQNQAVRTALAWKRLKTDNYLVRKIIRYVPDVKKGAERTEQTAPRKDGHAPLDA